jgi:hypothetical protein
LTYPGTIERFATLPNIARRLPKPPVCPSRNINTSNKQFEQLAENFVEGPLVATPALLDRSIFLRTDSHLYRIGKQ